MRRPSPTPRGSYSARCSLVIALAATACFSLLSPAEGRAQQDAPVQPAAPSQSAAPSHQPVGPAPLTVAAAQLPEVVARVDGDPITRRELLAQAQTMRLQAIQAGSGDPSESEDFLTFVLEALIGERLVYADSQTRGVGPTEAEIEARVQKVIAAYGGEAGFEKALGEQGLDRKYVRRQVRQTLSFDRVMEAEIVPSIEVSEQAMRDYYERYREQMRVPAYYKVRHIMKHAPEGASADVRQRARAQLEALREQLVGGADFAELARVHSDDARTREQGGGMPWIVLTGREGSFEPAVAALAVGELSPVVETAAGLHLIRLEDFKPARTQTFEEAQEEIRNVLGAIEARKEIQRRVARLRSSAKIEILM